MLVLFRLGDEIDIGRVLRHFMKTDVAVGRLAGNTLDEIIPGKIDACLIYMPHERAGIEPIMIVIAEMKMSSK